MPNCSVGASFRNSSKSSSLSAPEPTPNKVATANILPLGLTATCDGYQPVGMRPMIEPFLAFITATALIPAQVTNKRYPSGSNARAVGTTPATVCVNGWICHVAETCSLLVL